MLGIGNVCVDSSHASMGLGSILIASINAFIKETQTSGILLCKEKLVDFYKLSNWKTIVADEVFVCGQQFNQQMMVYDPLKKICWERVGSVKFSRNF